MASSAVPNLTRDDARVRAELLRIAIDSQRWIWQYATIILYVLVAWLVGLTLLFVAGKVLSALTLRSRIVPAAAEGHTNRAVAHQLRVTGQTVGRWRSSFLRR